MDPGFLDDSGRIYPIGFENYSIGSSVYLAHDVGHATRPSQLHRIRVILRTILKRHPHSPAVDGQELRNRPRRGCAPSSFMDAHVLHAVRSDGGVRQGVGASVWLVGGDRARCAVVVVILSDVSDVRRRAVQRPCRS